MVLSVEVHIIRHNTSPGIDYVMDWIIQVSNPDRNKRFLFSPKRPHPACDPPSVLFNGYRGSFPEVKREVYHSPQSAAQVKNGWSCTSTHSVFFHGRDRDKFTFTFTVLPGIGPPLTSMYLHMKNYQA